MKNLKSQIVLLTLILSCIAAISNAQSIVGSWKKTDEVLLKENGKATSTLKMLVKNMPCFANIVYIFSPNGKVSEQAKDCTPALQKQIADELANSSWKMDGNKLSMDVHDKNALVKHAEYKIDFVGPNEMIWTFTYAENPGVPNITHAREMKTTYLKINN